MIQLLRLWRSLPLAVRDLVILIVREIAKSPEPDAAARRALEASRTLTLDEMLKERYPR